MSAVSPAKSRTLPVALALLCCSARAGVGPGGLPGRPPGPQVPAGPAVFGHSVQNRPLRAFVLGRGRNVTMILGGFHGNERSGPGVVERLRADLQRHPDQWPGCKVVLVPYANPDGWEAGTRVNARRVDINRNFPGTWAPGVHGTRHDPGPSAASEPETRAIMALVGRYSPAKVVSIHQPLHLLTWTGLRGRALAVVMGRYNHYPLADSVGYATPGAFGDYCGRRGIAIVTLEMPPGSVSKGWRQNRGALLAAVTFKE